MKKNDTGDFSVFYVEPDDDKSLLFQTIGGQKKPVVIMLAEQARVFLRPDDFATLKHVKRQLDLPIVFVIPSSGHMAQLAARNGFPVYLSMDALADALSVGQLARQRSVHKAAKPTIPLSSRTQTEPLQPDQSYDFFPVALDVQQRAPKNGFSPVGVESKQATPINGFPPIVTHAKQQTPGEGLYRVVPPTKQPTPPKGMPQVSMPRKTLPLSLSEGRTATTRRRKTGHLSPAPPQIIAPPTPRSPHHVSWQSRRIPLLLIILVVAILVSGVGFWMVQAHTLTPAAVTPTTVGHVAFTSSEQLSESSSQGIEDQVVIDLNSLPSPAVHKSYYAWLLGDKSQSDPHSLLLGTLQVNNGQAHLFYQGDAQHTNLLLLGSRFLVTEEDASVLPVAPSPDLSTWRYTAAFSSTPINDPANVNHFSLLDHMRHLLGADPTLEQLELPGGLNNWFFRNSGKLVEWVSSLREQWEEQKDIGLVRRQTTRVLQYIDGSSFAYQDLPPNTPLFVDARLSRIGLMSIKGPNQDPPGYVTHIVRHLDGLLQASNGTTTLRKNISDLLAALDDVNATLLQLRQDAIKIVTLTDAQLQDPSTLGLINTMIDDANHAYSGQLNPNTNTMREGVVWIHDHMQSLAIMNVSTYSASGPVVGASHQLIPATQVAGKAWLKGLTIFSLPGPKK